MKYFYRKVENWIKKWIPTGGFLWRILVFPQRFQRHGFRIFKGYWEAQETRKMVEPLKTRQFKKDHVSIVINSAGRKEYLRRTVKGLQKYFQYDPGKTSWLIIEDYPPSQEARDYIKSLDIFDTVIFNNQNRGLGYSINRIFAEIQSEFVFYCQEDRELLRPVPVRKMMQILRDNPHLSQLLVSNEDKPFVGAKQTEKGYREYYRMFSFSPYLASMEFFREHLPFPFYFTNVEFSFKVHKKGWHASGIFGEEDEPPYARHLDLGNTRKVWVVK